MSGLLTTAQDVFLLAELVTFPAQDPDPATVLGQCSEVPAITTTNGDKNFRASITSFDGLFTATITDDRYLTVTEGAVPVPKIEIV